MGDISRPSFFVFSKLMFSTNRTKLDLGILLSGTFLAAAWLVPNHYLPWVAAWGDALAIVGVLLVLTSAMAYAASGARVSWQLAGVAVLVGVMLLAQFVTGKLLFGGDALMAAFYVGLWLASVLAGRLMAADNRSGGLNALTAAWLFAALLSVGIALVQWTGAFSLGIYAADLPPGARPFANVAQPNHLCTLCFLGLCSLLWQHQDQRVSGLAFWLGAGFLLLGMVMTQSRTGWLQMGLLIAFGLCMRMRADLRITRTQLLMLGAVFVVGTLMWPLINDVMLLSAGRSLDEQMRAGVRLPYWWAMLDAIGREPLWGYGWQQVGAAQQRVALDHPAIAVLFEHSHNLVLDLLLWNGIPAGVFIIAALAWWFIAYIRACCDAQTVWLLGAVGGIFTHGMLEFPLEYAYFLIPAGLAMGAVEGLLPRGGPSLYLPRWVILSFTGLLTTVFLWTAVEYLEAEENFRTLRMESARIGVDGIVTPASKLRLLTQLEAFLHFARTEATTDMPPDKVDWMRKVSERFGYPSVLFRYALATGLNGQTEVAHETLARLCRIHEPQRCIEAHEAWMALQARYPQLAGMGNEGQISINPKE